MNNKGFFMLMQVFSLSILLLAAAAIFSVFRIYSENQVMEDAKMTAVYLAQKEIAMIEGEILTEKKFYDAGTIKEASINKNNVLFHINTSLSVNDKLKTVTAKVNWTVNGKQAEFDLRKTVYTNE
ncbi:hypothetical protein [Pectinatus haikarae]|uniref:Competence protein ComGG n=1 Tax=Pectinatus haikarae TaxID=349096 RepID=A0ABT9Y8M8_9FIRM|nr:hypothetical protein [Pectinatus haikarae]MDQ0204186.1 hypothetical protein [Pectinatus haikarae]